MTPSTELTNRTAPRSPSTAAMPLLTKAREDFRLFCSHWSATRAGDDFSWVYEDVDSYRRLLSSYGTTRLEEARVLEIGYGARPFRLIALQSMGIDAEGVDAEVPILEGRPAEFMAALRVNGFERLLKSTVRRVLFDSREHRQFVASLGARGLAEAIDRDRFHVADAATFEPVRSYDLIISEDVFEHVATKSLSALIPKMASWLAPGGIALIRPNIFTGITGGHALDWSRHSFMLPNPRRTTEPWDHLLSSRHSSNTYLNRLTRRQYREYFSREFEILEEEVSLPDLGREFLTGDVARELSEWSEEELFSNQVRMVLRPHRCDARS
jgi:hypothetical protein